MAKSEPAEADHRQNGDVDMAKEKYKDAVYEYKKVLEADPNNADTYHNLGLAYDRLGKYQEALKCYEKALQIKPDVLLTIFNTGVVYDHMGKQREAIEYYEKALKIYPNYTAAYNNLGVICTELGEYKKAVGYYEKILRLEPNYINAYINLGRVYIELKQYEEAIKYLEKARDINPNYDKVYKNLGLIYDKLGQRQKAEENHKIAKLLFQISNDQNCVLVTEPSKRVSGSGLSVLPPQGMGWFLVKNPPIGGLGYGNGDINDPLHTLSCNILIIVPGKEFKTPDEFLAWAKQEMQADADPKRFKNDEYVCNLNTRFGPYGVEYKATATDTKWKTPKGDYLTFKIYGYLFVHPKSPKEVVDIMYSERGAGVDFTPLFKKVGDNFISSLIFEE
jgi:tetratricopeptide (TPR) repeat protein